jgi:cell division protein FtsB
MNERGYDPDTSRWHVDKRVNAGHLLTTLLLAASVFAWGSAIDRRLAVAEVAVLQNEKDNKRQDEALKESSTLIREDIRAMRAELREIAKNIESRSGR